MPANLKTTEPLAKVRLDKWLWAARFYKTRTIAKEAVEGGKVHFEGHRVKPSKEVIIGSTIRLKQGWDDKVVVVTGLAERRGNAKEAALLYKETPDSIQRREAIAEQRKLANASAPHSENRPNKKERRQIMRFNKSS